MNRLAHLPRTSHAKPSGFDACACVRSDQRGIAGLRHSDTTG
jgi:hypothetical protein